MEWNPALFGAEAATLMAEIDMARGVIVKEEADLLRSGDWAVEADKKLKDLAAKLAAPGELNAPAAGAETKAFDASPAAGASGPRLAKASKLHHERRGVTRRNSTASPQSS